MLKAKTAPHASIAAFEYATTLLTALAIAADGTRRLGQKLSPLFQVQPQIAQEYAPYSVLPSMNWRAPVFPQAWDAVVPLTWEEHTRAPDRASKPD